MTEQEQDFRGLLRAFLFGAIVVASSALVSISMRWQ